eukprot:982814-Pelagomonas_calceolata.AAC.7
MRCPTEESVLRAAHSMHVFHRVCWKCWKGEGANVTDPTELNWMQQQVLQVLQQPGNGALLGGHIDSQTVVVFRNSQWPVHTHVSAWMAELTLDPTLNIYLLWFIAAPDPKSVDRLMNLEHLPYLNCYVFLVASQLILIGHAQICFITLPSITVHTKFSSSVEDVSIPQ